MGNSDSLKDAFPVLPGFKAQWRPIYWEPILLSGERFTVAVLIKSASGAQIQSVLRPSAMRALYGKKAAGIRGFTELIADSLQSHLAAQKSPNAWLPPISGMYLGDWRESLSDSLDGVLAQAVQQVSSLSWEDLSSSPAKDFDALPQEVGRKKLIEQVKEAMFEQNKEFIPYFEREGSLVDGGIPVRFGFLGRSVVAHFGLLRPHDISRSYKDARGRLWELQKANRRADFKHAGLILQLPSNDNLLFDYKQLEQAQSALFELRCEAEDESVEVLDVHTPPEAANVLIRLAA